MATGRLVAVASSSLSRFWLAVRKLHRFALETVAHSDLAATCFLDRSGYGGGYGYGGGTPQPGLYAKSDEMGMVRLQDSQTMGNVVYSMLQTDPKTWLVVADLPEIIPRTPNSGSDVGGFASFHSGGINGLVGDGAVRFLSENIDHDVLQQLGNRADKTLIQMFDF